MMHSIVSLLDIVHQPIHMVIVVVGTVVGTMEILMSNMVGLGDPIHASNRHENHENYHLPMGWIFWTQLFCQNGVQIQALQW